MDPLLKVHSFDTWTCSKTAHDFGDLFNIYNLITVGAGLELAPDLAPKFGQEPSDWRAYYIQKHGSIDDADTDALVSQAEKEYTEAQAYLKTFQKDGNVVVLGRVASKMIWILGKVKEWDDHVLSNLNI